MKKFFSKEKFTLPNCITMLRILGTICLPFTRPFTTAFYVVYTICGLSDVVDGFIARKTKTTSEFGAKLDSIADLLFYSVMLILIMPFLWAQLPREIWIAVGAILLLRIISYSMVAIRYRRMASLHTYGNKVTGLGIFAIPYFLNLSFGNIYCFVVCAISAITTLEEFLIHALTKTYQTNVKTIFQMGKNNSTVAS